MLAPPRIFRRDALALLVSLGIMSASNYAFHLIVSRSLGPGEYGALSSLLAVLLVMSVPLNTLQTVVAKRTAELRGAGRAPGIPPSRSPPSASSDRSRSSSPWRRSRRSSDSCWTWASCPRRSSRCSR